MKRIAITGMGAMTAAGVGVDALWTAARDGVTAAQQLNPEVYTINRIRVAAAFKDYDPLEQFPVTARASIDRFAALALLAAAEAIAAAGWPEKLDERTAVIVGTGLGGATTTEAGYSAYYGGQRGDPMGVPKIMPNAAASQISMRYGARGPTFAISSACASSAQAVGIGYQMVKSGMVDRAIVGGSEAMLAPGILRQWELMRVLTPGASRPFSKGRDGMVIGEGAAILCIEDADAARARGAKILTYLAGYGTSSDANDLLRPDPEGAASAMRQAIADAGLQPIDIGYVNAHGTGTILNDTAETAALRAIFGDGLANVPVSSTKPIHGHTIGAAGAVELVVSAMALRDQIAPPTINWLGADPGCVPDPVANVARPAAMKAVMSNSFAFGGINASLILMPGEA